MTNLCQNYFLFFWKNCLCIILFHLFINKKNVKIKKNENNYSICLDMLLFNCMSMNNMKTVVVTRKSYSHKIYLFRINPKHPVYEGCCRVTNARPFTSASRSFILSPSPTRLSPSSISSVHGMNHRIPAFPSVKRKYMFFDNFTKFLA